MDIVEQINKLKKELEEENSNENTDSKKVNKITQKIALLGIGLNPTMFGQKPFTNV
jgi:hypothetical protein